MTYSPNEALREAKQRLQDAMDIPGWRIPQPYADVVRGERWGERMMIVSTGISGVLRVVPLVRATNNALQSGLQGIGEGQVKLVGARRAVVDLRVPSGDLTAGLVMPRSAFAEVEQKCPDAIAEQRNRLRQAINDGWTIGVVDDEELREAVQPFDPTFVSSISFEGLPGNPTEAAYMQTDPVDEAAPYEFWIDDPAQVIDHRQLYARLARLATPLSRTTLI